MKYKCFPLAVVVYVIAVTAASAQQTRSDPRATGNAPDAAALAIDASAEPTGRVTTLPGDEEGRDRSELVAGHIYLFGKTLDQAIDDLQNSDLKAFAKSYRRMVASYGQLADQVGDASQSLGEASNQIVLAKHSLARVGSETPATPERKTKLTEDIGQIRAVLIGKLSSVRARLDGATGAQRQTLLTQVQGLVERIHQLDQLSGSLRDGSQPLLPGLAADKLDGQLDSIANALAEERQMLAIVSESVRLLVDNTSAEMRRTMQLLQIESQIPNGQMQQLLSTRASVQKILDDVTAAHQRASNSALEILSKGTADMKITDEGDLLKAVDALIDSSHGTMP